MELRVDDKGNQTIIFPINYDQFGDGKPSYGTLVEQTQDKNGLNIGENFTLNYEDVENLARILQYWILTGHLNG
jgi:hypothetical protein